MSAEPSGSYRFGPRDRRGLVVGVRSGQAVVVTAALVLAVGVLRSSHGPAHGLLALLVALGGAAIAWLPIGGRSLEEWLPVVTQHSASRIAGTNKALADLAGRSTRAPAGALSAITVIDLSARHRGLAFGILRDRSCGTMSAVLSLAGEGFALLSKREQEHRLEAWANVLAALANAPGVLFRLQWIERTVPDHGEEIRRKVELAMARQGRSEALVDAQRSYLDLVEVETRAALRHESWLVVTISLAQALRHQTRRPRADRELFCAEMLAGELALVRQRCLEAGIAVDGAVSVTGLRTMLRRSTEDLPKGVPVSWPWPLAWETRWSSLRTDGTWHVTYWVLEWPRSDVPGDFLRPLLLSHHDRHSVSVVMAPLSSQRATHAAEHARTSAAADNELRRRHGFAFTARSRREHEGVLRRERELAEGHGAYRFSGYLTVSAKDPEELERCCARIEQAGALVRLELRRLYGKQGDAFCCTLPLGRGRA